MDISFISSCSCSFCDFFGGTTTRQQVPQGQINMRDARVEEVDHVSDSDSEEADGPTPSFGTGSAHLTVGIFPANQDPTYLLFSNKQVPSPTWHRTIVSLNRNGFFKKKSTGKRFVALPADHRLRPRRPGRHSVRANHPETHGNRRRSRSVHVQPERCLE